MSCSTCNKNSIMMPSMKQAVHGIKSLVSLVDVSNYAPEEVIKQRRDKCRECPEATKNEKYIDRPSKGLTNRSQCKQCACLIYLKTMIQTEKCPQSLW